MQPATKVALIRRVAAPIRGDNVESAVAVEVARGNCIPPTVQGVESGKLRVESANGRVPRRESAVVIAEDFDRTPVTRENEFRKSVASEIAENSAGDEAEFMPLDRQFVVVAVVAVKSTAGSNPTAEENIEIAVSVDVSDCNRPDTGATQ